MRSRTNSPGLWGWLIEEVWRLVQEGGNRLLIVSPPGPSALVFPKPVPLHRAPLALRLTPPFPTALSPGRSPGETAAEGTGNARR